MTSNEDENRLIDTFIRGLEETKTITQNLQNAVHTSSVAIKGLEKDVSAMDENLDWLIRTIRDENGDKSVIARLIILENQSKATMEWVEIQKKKEENKSKTLDIITNEEHKGNWQLKLALATGGLGLITTIITTILSFFFKK
jgi:CHASE3 domain sensor protein